MAKPIHIDKDEFRTVPRQLLDYRLGYTLLLDRRVPVTCKAGAVAIGIAVVALLEFLELPIEEVIAIALPIVGVLGDAAFAGMEAILGPLLIACLMLPHLAPSTLVDRIRHERAPRSTSPDKPIIDI
jgi:hypothetical protein